VCLAVRVWAVLATIVRAGAATLRVTAAAMTGATAADGNGYAATELAQATLPPGAEPTTTVVTSFLTIEPEPVTFPNGDQHVPEIVSVSTPHGSLGPLLADCALTRSVLAVLPAKRAPLTGMRAPCSTQNARRAGEGS